MANSTSGPKAIGGVVRSLPISALRPDWRNPRFPFRAEDSFQDDNEVYRFIEENFDAISVAESISRHGFFNSEPLIAIPAGPETYVVLEGNRRLAALRGLSDADLRRTFSDPRWKSIAANILPETEVPVLIADSREQVAPILGYRHVTGITPWDPFQQARYVAELIDDPELGLSATEVAERIGRDVSEVRSFYRNYSIVEQARDNFSIEDADRIVDEFGVWNRAMTTSGIRNYIGAPAPRDVVEGSYPLSEDAKQSLDNVVTWVFGDARTESESGDGQQSKAGRIISDSRELTRLGKVLSNDDGRAALESGTDLAGAEAAMVDKQQRFRASLQAASSALVRAKKDKPETISADQLEAIAAIRRALDEIEE